MLLLVTQVDNEAVYNICKNRLSVVQTSFTNLRWLIAQVVSSTTMSLVVPLMLYPLPLAMYAQLLPLHGESITQIKHTRQGPRQDIM